MARVSLGVAVAALLVAVWLVAGRQSSVQEAPAPVPDQSRWAKPYCKRGAVPVRTAEDVRAQASAGHDICVVAAIAGTVDLEDVTTGVHIGTKDAGSLGHISARFTEGLTISARFSSIRADGAEDLTIDRSVVGGSKQERLDAQLIFIPDGSTNTTISNSDIGWTLADDSGNTGYGIRAYGGHDGLSIVNNRIHDIAADGIQLGGGDDIVIDRNEIGPVGANPESTEHSDNIQIVDHGNNLRITNNWIHSQGYFGDQVSGNSGVLYVHGESDGGVLVENNLFSNSRGRVEVCGLGTGGTGKSNVTIRGNTFHDLGQAHEGFPGLQWACDAGTDNRVERNVAIDPDGGFGEAGGGRAVTLQDNVFGDMAAATFNRDLECTSPNCNPQGAPPIGYRKPKNVRW